MRVTLAAQLNALASGKIMDSDGSVDSRCFNFYDWFCKDASLQRKSKTLFGQVKRFLKFGPEVDIPLDPSIDWIIKNIKGKNYLSVK